ncbi:MAG TPA: TonB-dependent receptor, partial [Bacteroidetes bacterium]|nr:TonB-dependent receptor [Bacteroidota bacterium]
MQKKILLILLFFFSLTAYSQTNTSFSGKVIDTSNNEPLIGAFVTTLDGGKGAATDIDGNFVINSLNGSQFEIKCSYIGYKDKIIKINLEELNDDLIIKMSPDGVVLDHVEVVARKISRSEASVVALQKKSSTIISGISRQQMSSAGASNAASALKKVTGVNVQEGKYVYVRGLSDRYGKTLLNGAIIPSLDPERNTVQMDLFPGNILENILVFKTFSPKLPGDFAGGLVDIKTIDFPDNFTLGFSIKAGYSPQSSLRPDFLTFEGGKLDFLGVPDRTYNI